MVRKHFCDKCGKEIDKEYDDFEDMFDHVSSGFGKGSKIIEPQLCKNCERGYNKIIKEVNKKIKVYLKD